MTRGSHPGPFLARSRRPARRVAAAGESEGRWAWPGAGPSLIPLQGRQCFSHVEKRSRGLQEASLAARGYAACKEVPAQQCPTPRLGPQRPRRHPRFFPRGRTALRQSVGPRPFRLRGRATDQLSASAETRWKGGCLLYISAMKRVSELGHLAENPGTDVLFNIVGS